MALTWPVKDPDDIATYSWTPAVDAGDTVADAALSVVSGSAVIDTQDVIDGVLVAKITGGTSGEVTEFLGRLTTGAGLQFDETIYLPVQTTGSDGSFIGQFIAAFPAFSGVASASIAFWHTQALLLVEPRESCLGARYDLATMLATAWYMTDAGLGTGAEAEMSAQGMSSFKVIKSGTLNLERADASKNPSQFDTNSYGRRLWAMLRPCVVGPRVTGTGALPAGLLCRY